MEEKEYNPNFLKMQPERLDRTTFKHHTLDEAAYNREYWLKHSYEERLKAAKFLNSMAYNFDINNPPRMDKTYFKIRERS